MVIGFSLSQYLFTSFLSFRQYKVLCRTEIPKTLKSKVDQATYDKSQAYGRAKAKFGFVNGLFSQAIELAVLGFDLYPKLWSLTGHWLAHWAPARFSGEISHSLLFIFTYSLATTIIGLPFDYYHHFVLEEKFGFNKQTLKLWITDFFKGQALAFAFGVPLGSAFLAIIQKTGDSFFYYLYVFALAVQIFFITIYPIAIVPLFNKLTPLGPGSLKDAVDALAAQLKFPLAELQVIDGSKRSAHSNAYFTGLPWKKKIVLFDTLIEQSEETEVVAVLAHELGHWKMGHVTKSLGIAQFHMFFIFALFSCFLRNRSLYESFGFYREQPIIVGFLLFNEILAPADSVVRFLMNVLSRKFEFEADAFGARLGYSKELASALFKLQIKNLSAMDCDWMYSAYHHSHPILTERLRALGWVNEDGSSVDSKITDTKGSGDVKASGREL